MQLIVVANRLPLVIKKENNKFIYKQSSGGLATGLKCVKNEMDFIWVGNVTGINKEDEKSVEEECWEKYKAVPVFVSEELNEASYNGFCNNILWPMLHSFDNVTYDKKKYDAYEEYNSLFLKRVKEIAKEGDVVWIHDYHLMLLPRMVREGTKAKVAYFLHTPFPSDEVFSSLPNAKKLLQGILGAEKIGFHLPQYRTQFIDACKKVLSSSFSLEKEKKVKLSAIPIGIDPSMFKSTLQKEKVKQRIKEIKEKFRNKKIILGVDRTDYIKGMPQRMKAYELYTEKYGNNTVFLQIGVPSRMDIHEYSRIVTKVELISSGINSKGKIDENFVYYLNSGVDFEELCALYGSADVMLITSLRDGMNLVALEYIACQEERKGTLILSEFAGAVDSLPAALKVNPWSLDDVACKIDEAVKMNSEERKRRFEINKRNVEKFTAVYWAKKNVEVLLKE